MRVDCSIQPIWIYNVFIFITKFILLMCACVCLHMHERKNMHIHSQQNMDEFQINIEKSEETRCGRMYDPFRNVDEIGLGVPCLSNI